MKITKDSVGKVILNNGAHRVVLSAALVQAIGEQVYADSPRAECEGRMVVVDLGEVASGESEPIAYPALPLPVCPSCFVPAVLESVQDGGPECALSCPKCGAGWSEQLSAEVIEALLEKGAEERGEGIDDPEEEDDGDDEEEDNEDGRVHRRWLAERFMDEMQDAGDGDHTTGYGAFPGGDPRLFEPDPECSTPEEREAHRVACQEADAMEARGEVPDWPSAHSFGQVGNFGVHIASSMFGLGTYAYEEAPDER